MLLYRALCLIIDTSLFALCFGEFVMSLFKDVLNKNRIAGMAIVAAALFTPAIASAATAYISASVNVRSGPGANYGRLATLPAGVAVNAGSCRNGWCQIYNGNSVGFVSARYVRFGSYNGAYAAPSTQPLLSAMMVTIMVGHPASDLASV